MEKSDYVNKGTYALVIGTVRMQLSHDMGTFYRNLKLNGPNHLASPFLSASGAPTNQPHNTPVG